MWSDFIHNFHFLRPWALLALLGYPLFAYIILYFQKANPWEKVCDPHLLKELLKPVPKRTHILELLYYGTIWLIATLALSGPAWRQAPEPLYHPQHPYVFALDLSMSMNEEDIKPNRLVWAKMKLQDLMKILHGQMGLIAFSGEAYVVSPLTQDHETLIALLQELTPDIMPVQGNNLLIALTKAQQLIQQAGETKGDIILLTSSDATSLDVRQAKLLAHHGIRTSILQVSKGVDAKIDSSSLQALATAGDGIYQNLTTNNEDIQHFFDFFNQKLQANSVIKSQENMTYTLEYKDEGIWFAMLLLPFALILFRRGTYV